MPERIDDGGPAFPVDGLRDNNGNIVHRAEGMSRRDYFAAKALPALIACFDAQDLDDCANKSEAPEQLVARRAYAYADAMIAASKEPRHG